MGLNLKTRLLDPLKSRAVSAGKKAYLPVAALVVTSSAITVVAFSYGGAVSVEPESGTLANGATTVADASASGDQSLKFGTSVAPVCTGAQHTPDGSDSTGGCWPGPNTTGVPTGTTLTNYTGPCVITVDNTVIDAKTITCDMTIQAANVQVTRSKFVNGSIATDEGSTSYSFTISDSEINIGDRPGTGVGAVNFTATRVYIIGGNRSAHCWNNCTITDSYANGQFTDDTGVYHESGFRMGANATFRHNSIGCDAEVVPPDAGCSAALTGYGDFAAVENNLIENNLFLASNAGFCAYGGSSNGKPYSDATNNIVYKDNVFQRGTMVGEKGGYVCAYYGPITDFNISKPGNIWTNNKYDDGTILNHDGTTA